MHTVKKCVIAFVLVVALSACGSDSEEPAEPQAQREQPTQELSITVTDSGTEVSSPSVEAGPIHREVSS